MTSRHYTEDRQAREHLIQKIGIGQVVRVVRWDRGHINGAEIHKITSTGIIVIYNERTGKMITKIIARPAQIKRYWNDGNAPEELINIAREHNRKKR